MNNNRILYLHQQYLSKKATPEEIQEFKLALEQKDTAELLKSVFDQDWDQLQENQLQDISPDKAQQIFTEIVALPITPIKTRKLWMSGISRSSIAIAASIALVFFGATLFYFSQHEPVDIAPGKNTATLTLANGKVITLSDLKSGIVIGSQSIVYNDKTAISDQDQSSAQNKELLVAATPRGGTYTITLPDGSKVWLNAASSLQFPSSFSKSVNRTVVLNGEAYFEISKDKAHPFIVKTGKQEVEVLGTQFNINSYNDEPDTKTTLVEGSVKVSMTAGSQPQTRILVPGQQSVVRGAQINLNQVDLKQAVAWKNGHIEFHDADIYTIMRQLSRWYNVEVIYEADLKDLRFGGSISKYKNISEILALLESTGEVHFRIEPETAVKGRRITVMR